MSLRAHGNTSHDAHPADSTAAIPHEFDRLSAVGAVRHDGSIRAEECDRHLRRRRPGVGAFLHEQLLAIRANDDRVVRSCKRPDIRSRIGLLRASDQLATSLLDPDSEVQPNNRSYSVTLQDGTHVDGRLLNRDVFSVQLLDSSEQLRSFARADLRGIEHTGIGGQADRVVGGRGLAKSAITARKI